MEREHGERFALFSKVIDLATIKKLQRLQYFTENRKYRLSARLLDWNVQTMVLALVWQKSKDEVHWEWEAGMTAFVDLRRECVIPLMCYDELYDDVGIDGMKLIDKFDSLLIMSAVRGYTKGKMPDGK